MFVDVRGDVRGDVRSDVRGGTSIQRWARGGPGVGHGAAGWSVKKYQSKMSTG